VFSAQCALWSLAGVFRRLITQICNSIHKSPFWVSFVSLAAHPLARVDEERRSSLVDSYVDDCRLLSFPRL
jgi:hypothetical protein